MLKPHEAGPVALAEACALQRDAGHYEAEGLPRELVIAGDRVLPGQLERAPLQALVVKQEAVAVPSQQLHGLPVL